ncbi:MAG: hypothetical protein ABWZ86_04010 [Hyphomicrobium sp.]
MNERRDAEWTSVGIASLARINRNVMLMEWQTFQDNRVGPNFIEYLHPAFAANGVSNSEFYFLGRSGRRSQVAAEATPGRVIATIETSGRASKDH